MSGWSAGQATIHHHYSDARAALQAGLLEEDVEDEEVPCCRYVQTVSWVPRQWRGSVMQMLLLQWWWWRRRRRRWWWGGRGWFCGVAGMACGGGVDDGSGGDDGGSRYLQRGVETHHQNVSSLNETNNEGCQKGCLNAKLRAQAHTC